jgi:hypothetical protein
LPPVALLSSRSLSAWRAGLQHILLTGMRNARANRKALVLWWANHKARGDGARMVFGPGHSSP